MTKPYSSMNKSTKKTDTLSKGEIEKVSDITCLLWRKIKLSQFSKSSSFCLIQENSYFCFILIQFYKKKEVKNEKNKILILFFLANLQWRAAFRRAWGERIRLAIRDWSGGCSTPDDDPKSGRCGHTSRTQRRQMKSGKRSRREHNPEKNMKVFFVKKTF